MTKWKSLVVDSDAAASGTQLSYIDTGAPSDTSYTTIFALHGLGVNSAIFKKLMPFAFEAGLRFVAVNRRGYPGTTPYTSDEMVYFSHLYKGEKAPFLQDRGREIMTFIDVFIREHHLPATSVDGKSGGVALLGWSMGAASVLAAIASVDSLTEDVQSRLASHLRSSILMEPPNAAIGLTPPPGGWCPLWDEEIPLTKRVPLFVQWAGGYFDHGNRDLSVRDIEIFSNIVPSTHRTPTIFTMSSEEQKELITISRETFPDIILPLVFEKEIGDVYRKACFDASTRKMLPRMNIWEFTGDSSLWICVLPVWQIADDDKAAGGGLVNFKRVRGVNHFMHWDSPKETLDALLTIVHPQSHT